jgi:phosphatidylserine decarboxylase
MVVDGIYYALGCLAAGGAISYFTRPAWAIPFVILALFCLYFFRDPDRTVPAGPVAVSPADGKIVAVKPEGAGKRVSIFLSVFDVHVNRAPISGRITDVRYQTGEFLVASREEASTKNEMNTVTVEGDGTRIVFSQIAGLIARRIVFRKKPGDMVNAGERVGMIKFGSRVDVHFGPEWEVAVTEGARVEAGASILARRKL